MRCAPYFPRGSAFFPGRLSSFGSPSGRLLSAVLSVALLATSGLLPGSLREAQAAGDLKSVLDKGVRYLVNNQNEDGGYGPFGKAARVENASDIGLTAFVVYAISMHPRNYSVVDGPFLSRAVDYLLEHQRPDGGFYDPRDPALLNYRTSVALMALNKLDRVRYADPIRKAQEFLKKQQRTEAGKFDPAKHLSYGAPGQSGAARGDLSNSAFTAEAFHESGLSVSDPFWKRLETFVSRCQNAEKVDPLLRENGIGTTSDYGFRYAPNDTRGPVETLDDGSTAYSSYGSMTYQGLKSLLYARVRRDDPRVQKAFEWISENFTVRENPGMSTRTDPRAGLQGLFYYYHTMAKTLSIWGEPILTDAKGGRHDWARELSEHLVSLQSPDGSWQNNSGRWWEDLPTLDTSYALISLSICYDELRKRPPPPPGKVPAGKAKAAAPPEKSKGAPKKLDVPAKKLEGLPGKGAGSGKK